MKTFAFIGVLLCLTFPCLAGEILWPNASNVAFTNTVQNLTGLTNSSATNVSGDLKSIYHTFQGFYASTGTNVCTNSIDSTVDPSLTQWVNETNFILTSSGSFEYQSFGKYVAFRFRTTVLATNSATTNLIFYMGQ